MTPFNGFDGSWLDDLMVRNEAVPDALHLSHLGHHLWESDGHDAIGPSISLDMLARMDEDTSYALRYCTHLVCWLG